jgi:hypothetical protein
MHLTLPLLIGLPQQFTCWNFAARFAAAAQKKRSGSGLTAVLPFLQKKIAANGRNFINAPVEVAGGRGAAIAHQPTKKKMMRRRHPMMFPR